MMMFYTLDFLWGPHTTDRFPYNFFSLQDWILPPVSPIARVTAHLRVYKVDGTLVIPLWKFSQFWVLLCDAGWHKSTFFHDWVVLLKFKQFFVRDKAKNSLFGSRELSLIVVALRISFKLPEMISLSGYVQMTVAGACVTSVGVIYTHWLESVA